MEIGQAQPPAGAARAPESARLAASADFDTFLTLLTAQMQNQDPLQPMESTEFVAQLAAFSAVEQQILTNERLAALVEGGIGDAANWIGREVPVDGPALFMGQPVDFTFGSDAAADATILVRDDAGRIVFRGVSGTADFRWDGTTADGTPATHGRYFAEREIPSPGGAIAIERASAFQQITEVRLDEAGATLVTAAGKTLSADGIERLR
ncbi:MAG: flagellar hook capping FlgD N-terminal domain-containing protein [Rubricella sp.]